MPIPGDCGQHILLWSRKWMRKHLWLLSIQFSPPLEYAELEGTPSSPDTVSCAKEEAANIFSSKVSGHRTAGGGGTVKWRKSERREEELPDLSHIQQYFQIHQQLIDISVEDNQLSLAQGNPPVWVWRGDHAALASSKEPIAGQLHIQCQAVGTRGNHQGAGHRHQDTDKDVCVLGLLASHSTKVPQQPGALAWLTTHLWGSDSFRLLVRM